MYVADAGDRLNYHWTEAGTWYLAGSNTVVYSNLKDELDGREYNMQTSNRWFRDNEFLIPARLIKRISVLRVHIKFNAVNRELYPGKSFPEKSAWSALKYEVLSFIKPNFSYL